MDDVLVVHHDTITTLMKIDKYFKLKPSSIGDPDIYLGAKLKYTHAPNGVWCWTLSPSKYVQEAFKNCETFLKINFDGKYYLPKMAPNPFMGGYRPETDMIDTLDPEYYSYILCYVDDVLVVHHDAMTTLMKIDKYFKLKPSSIGDPDIYLGAKLKYTRAPNGVWCWTLSPSKYVQEVCKNCKKFL